jgi:serine/threonine-protein kinase HipA
VAPETAPGPDRALALLFELYGDMPRQGPGSAATTRRALALLPGLPPEPRIADIGCGSGASSLVLAERGGTVIGIDIHKPFLARLRADAAAAALEGKVLAVAADMVAPPLAEGSLDLIWSEGAIYQIGFAAGLARWRPLLKPGGFIAVTEATWLTDTPPESLRAFWATAYPAMTGIAANEAKLGAAGFRVLDRFVLPAECWIESYYAPLAQAIAAFRARHPGDAQAASVAEEAESEIELYRRHGDAYGYVFYLAQRDDEVRRFST